LLVVWCSIHIDRTALKKEEGDPRRQSLAMFMREQPDGTAASAMQLAEDAFDDINTLGAAAFPGRRLLSMASISGTLSDHNTTEQKENNLINARRAQLLAPAAAAGQSVLLSCRCCGRCGLRHGCGQNASRSGRVRTDRVDVLLEPQVKLARFLHTQCRQTRPMIRALTRVARVRVAEPNR
jgi:hypothetical protein